jgi:myosin heavy subunit
MSWLRVREQKIQQKLDTLRRERRVAQEMLDRAEELARDNLRLNTALREEEDRQIEESVLLSEATRSLAEKIVAFQEEKKRYIEKERAMYLEMAQHLKKPVDFQKQRLNERIGYLEKKLDEKDPEHKNRERLIECQRNSLRLKKGKITRLEKELKEERKAKRKAVVEVEELQERLDEAEDRADRIHRKDEEIGALLKELANSNKEKRAMQEELDRLKSV